MDNLFETDVEPAIYADNADGLVIQNNRITNIGENAVTINHCTNVQADV